MPHLTTTISRLINTSLKPFRIKIIKDSPKAKRAINDKIRDPIDKPTFPKFINIGSGGWTCPKWHTLDKSSTWYSHLQNNKVDYEYDLTKSEELPFKDSSIEAIFCSHVIEHIPDEYVTHLFKEVYRVLKPGGFFRVTCPDIELIYDAFSRKDKFFMQRFAFHKNYHQTPLSLTASFLHCFAGVLVESHPYNKVRKVKDEEVEEVFDKYSLDKALDHFTKMIPLDSQAEYPAYHLNWFHHEKVIDMLKNSGFKNSYISDFGKSRSPEMSNINFFDKTHPWMSLYVECIKD